MKKHLQMTSRTRKQNYQLPSREEKADYVQRNFDEIAFRYDAFNDLATFGLHRRWKKTAVLSLISGRRDGLKILDLCCGSGDLTLLAARLLPINSEIQSLDFSENMLKILQSRLKKREKLLTDRNIRSEIRQGDAQNLESIPDGSLDGVIIGFGLRNLTDRKAALREIQRVLIPGCPLVVLDVGRVQSPFLAFFHRIFFEKITPWIGRLLHGGKHEMYSYLPASARDYPDQESLKEELTGLGFRNVAYRNFMFGACAAHRAETNPEPNA